MTEQQIRQRAQEYVAHETDAEFRDEVQRLLNDGATEELSDRFYTDLEFGTGGLRGVIGGGTNRMNPYIIGRATQGLAQYVLREGNRASDGTQSAVISYDSRRYSRVFALQTALTFAANGIRAYLFSSLRPTPELSYAVRQLGAACGVMITASHNPPEYNGYKVYWGDGAQIVAPHDTAIIEEVRSKVGEVKGISEDEAKSRGLLHYIDEDMDAKYVSMIKAMSIRPELLREQGRDVRIVYTPLHGTGAMMVERIFGDLGIQVTTVPEQREPDGEFPTVAKPNPEESEAMDMAVELGRRENADIVMGTDPDADRIGIAVPDGEDFRLITGNQLGVLLVDYVYSSLAELGRLPENPAFVKTIVTTELQRDIAEQHGAQVFDTLTGFKHIAALIRKFEQQPGSPQYVMGDEESYGYMIGTEVRDKDGISAALMASEMAIYHASQGKTVLQRLNEIYRQYGYYQEETISQYFAGQQGKEIMDGLMERLRQNPPQHVGNQAVRKVRDVERGVTREMATGEEKRDFDLPASNVLQFFLEDGTVVSARPSGTEPKIKFYASSHAEPGRDLAAARQEVQNKLDGIRRDIDTWIEEASA